MSEDTMFHVLRYEKIAKLQDKLGFTDIQMSNLCYSHARICVKNITVDSQQIMSVGQYIPLEDYLMYQHLSLGDACGMGIDGIYAALSSMKEGDVKEFFTDRPIEEIEKIPGVLRRLLMLDGLYKAQAKERTLAADRMIAGWNMEINNILNGGKKLYSIYEEQPEEDYLPSDRLCALCTKAYKR